LRKADETVDLPEELRNAPDIDKRSRVRNLLGERLSAHGYQNKSLTLAKNLAGAISKASFYNIFDENKQGEISKNSIIIIALGCQFTRQETEEVLKAGGFILTDSLEDKIIGYMLEQDDEGRLDLCNTYLVARKKPPLFDDRERGDGKTAKE